VDYDQVVGLTPADPLGHHGRGNALYMLLQYSDAAIAYERAVQLAPNEGYTHEGCGLVYYQLKRYPEAIEQLSRAIGIKPTAAAYEGRALAYEAVGQRDNAEADRLSRASLPTSDAGTLASDAR
jgi:tetratricopeptide (TPR) repeat protein